MPMEKEVRLLKGKWDTNAGWPKRLEWLEIDGLRGWDGQRFELRFPIMAIVGENGAGKSTILQSAASAYRQPTAARARKQRFASDFFPDTPWDHIRQAKIRYGIVQGNQRADHIINKPTDRWRGNPDRPERNVVYIDLSRVQPVGARTGYTKLANPAFSESSSNPFEKNRLARFSEIMGRPYDVAKMALTDAVPNREVPVLEQQGASYSGFHQGAGETTIAELLQRDLPPTSLVLIDEVESSLHPRAQRRLIRDLAERCRESELQILLTTHSPYVLEELPLEARAYIMQTPEGRREIVYGVSPEFAMTKMDDVRHPECELYVEDDRAARMLTEVLAAHEPRLVESCRTIPYGAASVGQSLGQMVANNRFPRPTLVFLDADKAASDGCLLLPGDDAPERVVFDALDVRGWSGVAQRTGRAYADVADACKKAMTLIDHHEWLRHAASNLFLDTGTLWQAMCADWANECLDADEAKRIVRAIDDRLAGIAETRPASTVVPPTIRVVPKPDPPTEPEQPPGLSLFDAQP